MTFNQWEKGSDLLDLCWETTSRKWALFLKPVACHLTCNGYAPFSPSVAQLGKHCGNDAVVSINSMFSPNYSENPLCSLFTHSEYGLVPIKNNPHYFAVNKGDTVFSLQPDYTGKIVYKHSIKTERSHSLSI